MDESEWMDNFEVILDYCIDIANDNQINVVRDLVEKDKEIFQNIISTFKFLNAKFLKIKNIEKESICKICFLLSNILYNCFYDNNYIFQLYDQTKLAEFLIEYCILNDIFWELILMDNSLENDQFEFYYIDGTFYRWIKILIECLNYDKTGILENRKILKKLINRVDSILTEVINITISLNLSKIFFFFHEKVIIPEIQFIRKIGIKILYIILVYLDTEQINQNDEFFIAFTDDIRDYFNFIFSQNITIDIYINKRTRLINVLNKLNIQNRLKIADSYCNLFTIDRFSQFHLIDDEFLSSAKNLQCLPQRNDHDYVKLLISTIYLNSSIANLSKLFNKSMNWKITGYIYFLYYTFILSQ